MLKTISLVRHQLDNGRQRYFADGRMITREQYAAITLGAIYWDCFSTARTKTGYRHRSSARVFA